MEKKKIEKEVVEKLVSAELSKWGKFAGLSIAIEAIDENPRGENFDILVLNNQEAGNLALDDAQTIFAEIKGRYSLLT